MTATSSASVLRIVKRIEAVATVLRRQECPSLAQQQQRFVRTSTSTSGTVALLSRSWKHHHTYAHSSTTTHWSLTVGCASGQGLHVSTNNDNHSTIKIDSVEQDTTIVVPVVSSCSGTPPPNSLSTATTTILLDLERQRATELVDQLLERTRELMTKKSSNRSDEDGQNHDHDHHYHHHHIIAYSGGVDSSLVAALVHQNVTHLACSEQSQQQQQQHSAEAVLGVSPAVPAEQIELARQVMQHIGMAFQTTPTREGEQPLYVANTGQACRACKAELYTTLQAVHRHATQTKRAEQQQALPILHLYNGTNADDLRDPTRVGLVAAAEFQVLSPLSLTTKADVRLAARHFGLPNWHVAASPCLRSRLALGVPATLAHLQKVDAAERFVRRALSDMTNETTNLRVRLLSQQRACLEVDEHVLELAQAVYRDNRDEWDAYLLDQLDFASFGMRAFASGSVATTTTSTTTMMTNVTTSNHNAANNDTTTSEAKENMAMSREVSMLCK